MTIYNFGKTITRKFYPKENDIPLSIPSQAAEIYLFENRPTWEAARAGTGALQTLSTWTQSGVSPYPQEYSFTPVDDPEPTQNLLSRSYWEAINFVAELTEQKQTVIREFTLERPRGNEDTPETTVDDVKEVFPAINSYLTDAQIEGFLSVAEASLKDNLLGRGVRWSRVAALSNTRLAIAYKALALSSLSQIKESGDRHAIRYTEFNKLYETTMLAVPLEVDQDDDGKADVKAAVVSTTVIAYN